ncbi:SGNH/GDSL hydrolase family protein [Heyndrickxia sporothermodurans]|uniref:SGNH/GDSL hydrolase family protein n=1 Tax=Heyndrickxia sporothermodurans TaxID=46224 RepID=UPI002DBC502F|nr:SGNH/GDSL hydrolase family protein [Heyndrickxia sporothermodurans]MEB6549559.1 SGNH/GDSL hydrolase family protein [Heyndrickxia sporothermodurans]MED3782614.1 SGNH/GDSL hydrolase family protein [Heyndrickxia sporothermodurans]
MNKAFIKIISFVSVISALLCLFGLGWVLKDQWTEAKTISPPKQTAKTPKITTNHQLQIAALGDSLTRGTGDPEGKGYVGYLIDGLENKANKKLLLTNSAIKGQTSKQLLSQIKQSEIQRQIKQADFILLTIGGNDLFQGGEALMNLDLNKEKKVEQQYLKNLKSIYSTLRSINKKATIFHIGLYNPFMKMEQSKLTSEIVRQWNYDSAELAADYKEIVYVPTFDLFELNTNDYLFNDKFHPNAAGYQLIAERVASLITFSEEKSK